MTLPDLQEFAFHFPDLEIFPADLEMMLGFQPAATPEPFSGMVRSALKEAPELFVPRAGFRFRHDVSFDRKAAQFRAGNHLFSPGKIIMSQIGKAEALLFFAATAGDMVTLRCRELNQAGEEVYGFILDTLGSLVAEKASEKMMDLIEPEISPQGLSISESYSPGYCNWDVAEQQKLFSFFPEGFLGITLSPSSLMYPVKSISGVIGIGTGMKRNGYRCRTCNDKTCIYRKIRNPHF